MKFAALLSFLFMLSPVALATSDSQNCETRRAELPGLKARLLTEEPHLATLQPGSEAHTKAKEEVDKLKSAIRIRQRFVDQFNEACDGPSTPAK